MTLNATWRAPSNPNPSVNLQQPMLQLGVILKAFRHTHRASHPPNESPHLRRDIGLPVEHKVPGWWEL